MTESQYLVNSKEVTMSRTARRDANLPLIKEMFKAHKRLKDIADATGYSIGQVSLLARMHGCTPRYGGALKGRALKKSLKESMQRWKNQWHGPKY